MFTTDPMHTWDHGPGAPVLSQNLPRSIMEGKGLICMPMQEGSIYISRGANTPHGTPGSPQVNPKFELCNIPKPL